MVQPKSIVIKHANVNNLNNISIDIPLNKFVAICGVSGSGKSSLAMDVLYAEGSRRYLESLSAFTRIKLRQEHQPDVEEIKYLPSAIALKQRPEVPSKRSTVGTISEIFNVIRLAFSRLGTHICPNGHSVLPQLSISQNGSLVCPICSKKFFVKGAEDFSFNSNGKCQNCKGTGEVIDVKKEFLISDEKLSIRNGAIASWKMPGTYFLPFAAESQGVDIDSPFFQLEDWQKQIVMSGKSIMLKASVPNKQGKTVELKVTYTNAQDTLIAIYKRTNSEKTRQKIASLLETKICPECHGTRFSKNVLDVKIANKNIAEVSNMTLKDLVLFLNDMLKYCPQELIKVAHKIKSEIYERVRPLIELGLDYLTIARGGNTLSTGELQRLQLARTLCNQNTGVLYILDEPSIGLHPENIKGLIKTFKSLVDQGNSLVVVDHNLDVLKYADYFIEMGPSAGDKGGHVISKGTIDDLEANPSSMIAPFFHQRKLIRTKRSINWGKKIEITVNKVNNIKRVATKIPQNCLTSVVGISGSGKTSLILDGLVPGLKQKLNKKNIPGYIAKLNANKIKKVLEVNAAPIGKNSRSTVGTYTNIFDRIRTMFANTKIAKENSWSASYFSYNTKDGVCKTCNGIGKVSLDVQFLPNIDLKCPDCNGQRFSQETLKVYWKGYNISEVLNMSLDKLLKIVNKDDAIFNKISQLVNLGLGYLKLGEETQNLSGGESQRLKLVSEIGKKHTDTLFVFDEPSTGLHPLDIQSLIHVFDELLENGATIIYLEHDLDMIANSDYVIELGPESGPNGGHIIWQGNTVDFINSAETKTSIRLRQYSNK
ncbi:ATP-binding cassette domain-containing protein [Lactiplantibacillus plantarum]|uniref:ATP-binding cassette domain-containing protein n=1 Tax=Lactiplantibacillus plantarum TaxID=1590 RepID=UPI000978706F|nr:ATP-binding cassette domain-containing protein [Lactiplantibacillus plantarum]